MRLARTPGAAGADSPGAEADQAPLPVPSVPTGLRARGRACCAIPAAPLGLPGAALDSTPAAGSSLLDGAELVRILALALGAYWALRGLWRSWRSIQRYDALAASHGFSAGFVRRTVLTLLLRATLLDPLNLALLALLTLLLFGPAWPR